MFDRFIPYAVADSIYDIDIAFFKKHNVKTIIADLDNTLDSYRLYNPLPHAYELKNKLEKVGISLVIISNNRGKRVSTYANKLGVPYIAYAAKPFPFKINEYIKNQQLNKDEIMFIGDQMITDVKAARNAGIRVVLTNKLVKEDQWSTHINRIIGKRIRKYHQKHGNLINWRDK